MKGTLQFYWKLVLRRMPAMAALFLLCSAIGIVLAIRLPTIYATSARLLVEAPQISESLVRSTVQIEASEEIEIIRQQLLTRANLIDIANDLRVFAGEQLAPDQVVEAMRDATTIRASGGNRRGAADQPTIVDVGFRAQSGQIAASVVNEYVTRITAANVRNRTGVAEDTMDFFEQELERLSQELDERSAEITAFQRENASALPDGQQYRLNRQSLLQERVASITRDIEALDEQRERLTELFEATGRVSGSDQRRRSPEETRLAELEERLADALIVYSESNPRVVQIRAQIDRARQALENALPDVQAAEGEIADTQTALFNLQISEIESRIAQLEEQIAPTEAELERLQVSINQTPLNAITLASLQRDYENVRQQYDSAVARSSQASVGERIELTARGQRITLIEAANVPTSPDSPNRPLVAAAGVGVGGALAAGLFLLLELLNGTVRRPVDIRQKLGIVPLTTIPYLESRSRRMWRRTGRVATMATVLIGVIAALWAVDTYYLPLDLLAQRLLDQIGLA